MQLILAEKIKEMMEDFGEDCTIEQNYSGRSMYGNTTTGIVIGNQMRLLECILENAFNNGIELSEFYDENQELDIKRFNIDNFGYDFIIY